MSNVDSIRDGIPSRTRHIIVFLLSIATFIILVFQAEWLLRYSIVLLPAVCIGSYLAVGFKRAVYGTLLFVFFSFALWLRIGPSYDFTMGGEWIVFGGNDPWYHMRLVENLVSHFPFQITFDPYTYYPYGQDLAFAPAFDWLLALVVWVIGLGHPTTELIEKIGAYFPVVLGSLTLIPVYFIGRELFNRNVGLLAAGLLAIASGEFLFRSILGFTDHHIMEVFLSTTLILFLILAIKKTKAVTFNNIRDRDWAVLKKPLLYSLLAGLVLAIYLLSWLGGMLFALIIFVYLAIQYIIDYTRNESTDYLCITGIPMFLTALLVFTAFQRDVMFSNYAITGLSLAIVLPIILSGIARLVRHRTPKRLYYSLVVSSLALVSIGLFYLIDPVFFKSVYNTICAIFVPSGTSQTIREAQPLFMGFDTGNITSHRVWIYFTTGIITIPIALAVLMYTTFRKDKNPVKILLIVWSIVVLTAMISQTRFSYYFAINAAILTAYLFWQVPGLFSKALATMGWQDSSIKTVTRAERRRNRNKKDSKGKWHFGPKHAVIVLSVTIIFFTAVYPTLFQPMHGSGGKAFDMRSSCTFSIASNPFGPNEDWHEALTWMRYNTPEPFDDLDSYYDLYEQPANGEAYDYPDPAYGVMSWWDYGHWITRIAHRIPNANPHQEGIGGPYRQETDGASTFMTASNETEASRIMDALGSRYVVIDFETAYGKYYTMVTWAGKDITDYYDIWYLEPNGKMRSYSKMQEGRNPEVQLFYASYYESMCARLYNFDAGATIPDHTTFAVLWAEKTDSNGNSYREMIDVANSGNPFPTYEDAMEFVSRHHGYVIAGTNPFESPIPLTALEEYEPIYSSATAVVHKGNGDSISYVEVFEYTGYEE